jgi:Flp pilus assembly protein TadG
VRRSAARRRRWDDRGEIAANTAIFVLVILLLFVVLQFGLWFYGREVAAAAAQHAVDAARVENGSAAAGEATADQYLGQVGGLPSATVTVTRTSETVTARIDAQAVSIVGFIDPPITVTVTAPVERVVG